LLCIAAFWQAALAWVEGKPMLSRCWVLSTANLDGPTADFVTTRRRLRRQLCLLNWCLQLWNMGGMIV
jgi:hypothetical protein